MRIEYIRQNNRQKIEILKNCPKPQVKQLKSFLGLLNYYNKFIRLLTNLLHPLYELTKNNVTWNWSEACEKAFVECKEKLSKEALLVLFNPALPIKVTCDSSSYGVCIKSRSK